jgi:hypothetical protein
MTTDTPRTDAVCVELPATNFDCDCWSQVIAIADFARELERELAALETEFQHYRENQNTFAIALCEESEQRAEKAEAEVKMLKESLKA